MNVSQEAEKHIVLEVQEHEEVDDCKTSHIVDPNGFDQNEDVLKGMDTSAKVQSISEDHPTAISSTKLLAQSEGTFQCS